jgi:hypothetical protein
MGEVYMITNLITNKSFIGIAHTQHKFSSYNDRYKHNINVPPIGFVNNFAHIMNKSNFGIHNRNKHIESAITEYGAENFNCIRIAQCHSSELDKEEIRLIKENDTIFPQGYNLSGHGTVYELCYLYELELKDEVDSIMGQIYAITNIINGKQFIGGTYTHKSYTSDYESINYGKHLPYGYVKFFEELRNDSFGGRIVLQENLSYLSGYEQVMEGYKKTSVYNGIYKYIRSDLEEYGHACLKIVMISECSILDLDNNVKVMIDEGMTKYPDGLNLNDYDTKSLENMINDPEEYRKNNIANVRHDYGGTVHEVKTPSWVSRTFTYIKKFFRNKDITRRVSKEVSVKQTHNTEINGLDKYYEGIQRFDETSPLLH